MTQWVDLTGAQQIALRDALLELFDYASLTALLLFRLDKNLGVLVPGPAVAFEETALALVQRAKRELWADDLIVAVREARPGHPAVEKLIADVRLGASVTPSERSRLQRFYQDEGLLLDPALLRTKIGEIETRVCRIVCMGGGEPSKGTGFLVGPEVVMTNCHVMEPVIGGKASPEGVTVIFDYKENAAGRPLNGGNAFGLADDWLIDHSPYADSDAEYHAQPPETGKDELDYALLRLAEPAGCRPIRGDKGGDQGGVDPGSSERGWISVPMSPRVPDTDEPLFIMQHPAAGPMKLAIHPLKSVMERNAGSTRVRHRTATLGGSSGSPCFDREWNLVALHHAGDPDWTHQADYNQAIPFSAIVALLNARGLRSALGGDCA